MRLGVTFIGDLDTKFLIEQNIQTDQSVTNEKIDSWSSFKSIWGRWIKDSTDIFEAHQQVSLETGDILARYDSGITDTMRINDNGVYHYIKGIKKLDRNVSMILKTEKRDNG